MLQVEYVKIASLKPYKLNAKQHPKSQIEDIRESISLFGFNDPIAIDENNGIIEGHGRVEAMKELGAAEIPAIRLSHLDEEQKKAYILVHNQLTIETGFDAGLLELELQNIVNIDMSLFGFDLMPKDEEEPPPPDYKAETEWSKGNILNLAYAQFPGVGKYDIPEIKPVYEIPAVKEWVGFNYCLSDKHPEGKGVHFFVDDYQFERVWNRPDDYLDVLARYACVMAPDFSPYGDMPFVTQLFNHYRKHWVARYWQEHGITVIPTIRASIDPRSLDFYLDGEPKGSIVAYSSMWVKEGNDIYSYAESEWNKLISKLKPCKVICYGKVYPFMTGSDVTKIETFSEKRLDGNAKRDAPEEHEA